ncbi:MAG: ribonuclease H-like domain-containing protein [Proteobacteria bacterium]|nr:ribonuclease H-like domain-containing protein [Pseudomonadota bacterium]
MLKHTFCHIPRIGTTTEQRYWGKGLKHWADAASQAGEAALGNNATWVRQHLDESLERLEAGDARWFDAGLPNAESWRLFGEFRERVAYVDIETTGLTHGEDHITTIALSGAGEVRTYVHGDNLADFQDDIRAFDVIATFNGKCFDVPFIERTFGIRLDMGHIDLRYVLKKIGFSGGLKSIEKQMGIGRDDLDGVDGYFAVILWHEYQNTGNAAALETLLAYNAADVVNLESLLVHAYNKLLDETPFAQGNRQDERPALPVRHEPDRGLVDRLMARHGMF